MSVVLQSTVVGIFEQQDQVRRAIEQLLQAGFEKDQIGFVMREERRVVRKIEVETAESSGALTGGIVGGVLGAANALLMPVLGPSVANTIPVSALPLAEEVVDSTQHKQPEMQIVSGENSMDMGNDIDDEGDEAPTASREGTNGGVNVAGAEENNGETQATEASSPQDTPAINADDAEDDDDDTIEIPKITTASIADADTIEMPKLPSEVVEADTMALPQLARDTTTGDASMTAGVADTQESSADDETRKREDEATGALSGGIMGSVLGIVGALLLPIIGPAIAGGALVAVLGGATLGAVTGTILGSFVKLGVPEERARHYEEEFHAGRTIVTVYTDHRHQEVLRILAENGACYVSSHETVTA